MRIDLSGALSWLDGLPHPQWDLVASWVESRDGEEEQRAAWVAATREWLTGFVRALAAGYEVVESDHFQVLAPWQGGVGRALATLAERCRGVLLAVLAGVADFAAPGKQVVLALRTPADYYRYVAPFFGEGEYGASGGVHIREGYPHVALYGKQMWAMENVLAHELTHVSLHRLAMPAWLEEGLAQMFEHDATGRQLLVVNLEMAQRHKRYWGRFGLDAFWGGEGFLRPGEVQELSYQLAEILVRLLVEEHRPRWFGWVRGQQRRLFAFLRSARQDDAGEAASREHLGFGLADLAARFLGPGEWERSL